MADVDNEEVIKAIKDNIGNSADVNIFLEETIENKICEMFQSLSERKDFQQTIQSAVILCVNNAMNLIIKNQPPQSKQDSSESQESQSKDSKGGNRKTRKLRRI